MKRLDEASSVISESGAGVSSSQRPFQRTWSSLRSRKEDCCHDGDAENTCYSRENASCSFGGTDDYVSNPAEKAVTEKQGIEL